MNYSIQLNEEDFSKFEKVDPFKHVIMAIEEEIKTNSSVYSLSDIDITFILNKENLKVIHIEMIINEVKEDENVTMNIAIDAEFSNQGIQKIVASPPVSK